MVAYSFKAQFVGPIAVGLSIDLVTLKGVPIAAGVEILPKRQTIRANGKRRHARPGEDLQLYYAMRTKQCRKIGDALCVAVQRIVIWPDTMAIALDGEILTGRQITRLSKQDGFQNVKEMQDFWLREHGSHKFEGSLIRWDNPSTEPKTIG